MERLRFWMETEQNNKKKSSILAIDASSYHDAGEAGDFVQ